ncbi:MAG: sensor histidine kinase [Magnetococcales bacterium]|nr:sensor histidine kinase [Magnetococcales bacterium]
MGQTIRQWGGVVVLLWLILGAGPAAAAGEPLRLAEGDAHHSLAGRMALLLDPGGEMTLEQARRAPESAFRPLDRFWSGGFTPTIHWFRFTVMREPSAPAEWILAMGLPFLQDIQLFQLDENGATTQARLGAKIPFALRPLQTSHHALRVHLPPTRPVTFFVRVESNTVKAFTADLWTPAAYLANQTRESATQGMFLGLLGIIGFVYTIFGLWLRDWGLVAYAAVCFSLMMQVLGPHGYGAVLFAPADYHLVILFTGVSALSITIAAPIMWVHFLDMRRHYPRLRWLYFGLSAASALTLPLIFQPIYLKLVPVMSLGGVAITVISLGLVIHRLRQGFDIKLVYYFFAFLAIGVGAAALMGGLLGVLPINDWTRHGLQWGSIGHVVILIFAATHRIKRIQIDKFKAERQAELERKRAEEQRHMTAMLSHEFRTPLAAIDKAAQLVQLTESGLGEGTCERLSRIRDLSARLTGLIDLFLTAEALDHGGLQPHRAAIPLAPLLESLRERAPERLELVVDSSLSFSLDGDLILIAVGNLVDNALKYSPPESRVTVAAQREGAGLLLRVRDRGRGLTPEEVERLGTRYFRAQSAEGTKGTGLGVHMAQAIVASHGGAFAVQSRPGEGTEITLRLPPA